MKILIFGANGQVGKEAVKLFIEKHYQVIALSRVDCDVTNFQKLSSCFLKHANVDFVINCVAYTNVEQAEIYQEECFAVNFLAVKNMAILCQRFNVPLIHLSTDFVFDGALALPYDENAKMNALNTYGLSKQYADEAIQAIWKKHIILRVSWVFSPHNHNFVKSICHLACHQPMLSVVGSQFGGPTSAENIAMAISHIIEVVKFNPTLWGVYHFQGRPIVSWFEFAKYIVKELKETGKKLEIISINKICSADYKSKAIRPQNSVFALNKISQTFAIKPSDWRRCIKRVINEI